MKETLYPTFEEALYLHEVLIQRFGGKAGVLGQWTFRKRTRSP